MFCYFLLADSHDEKVLRFSYAADEDGGTRADSQAE